MSDDPKYSSRELELLFKRIDEKLDDIRQDIRDTNKHFDVRLMSLEKRVSHLEKFQTRALTLWAVGIFIITTLAGFILNRLF
jgi:Skp family chaperone for outer membrane proteins